MGAVAGGTPGGEPDAKVGFVSLQKVLGRVRGVVGSLGVRVDMDGSEVSPAGPVRGVPSSGRSRGDVHRRWVLWALSGDSSGPSPTFCVSVE